MTDVDVRREGRVAVMTLCRPPHNYFDAELLSALADALERADADPSIRACILRAEGRSFCAGAAFGGGERPNPRVVYTQGIRIMRRRKPLIATVGGAAIGGGVGLALVADLRVAAVETVFHANFARLGICAGFGISFTLPRVVGTQMARDLLLTTRRVGGEEALKIGLVDRLEPHAELDRASMALAEELALGARGALVATRALTAAGDGDAFARAIERELELQEGLFASPDFVEGVTAARERRLPAFSDVEEVRQ